ncbi:MAG: 2,3-bisphosphoglycerate-independent phosphoglycerate mutase, partial [Chloroflexi bacterium]|nr:2,3-bisphosphoglycerate-independent phosphoglycerate mutase [Chloroflexota bacterium]
MRPHKPVALIILDGWGLRGKVDGNAILLGNTPNYDKWTQELERTVLDASGEAVGLPDGQMGNSEVGHLNLGAGRVVYQDLTRINLAIRDGSFSQIPALVNAVNKVKTTKGSKLHVIGLFGPGGVHSHSNHMTALFDMANDQGIDPILHIITDGRDTPPQSSLDFLQTLEAYQTTKNVTVAS